MRRKRNALLSLVLIAALLCGFAACDKGGGGETTSTTEAAAPVNGGGETTTSPAQSGTVPSGTQTDPASSTGTQPSGVSDTAPSSTDGSTAQSAASSTATQTSATAAPTQAIPSTPAQVLVAYKTVMDKAKQDVKHFRKLNYQTVPTEEAKFESKALDLALPVAMSFVETKEKAMEAGSYKDGTDNTANLPVVGTPLGCMVSDPALFKSAQAQQLTDGRIKLTLVMKEEYNPEPPANGSRTSPSHVGGMFEPLPKKNIDDTLQNDAAVKVLVRNLEYSLRYYDCTAVLVYDAKTNHIETLNLTMHVDINITGGSVMVFSAKGKALLHSYQEMDQFVY